MRFFGDLPDSESHCARTKSGSLAALGYGSVIARSPGSGACAVSGGAQWSGRSLSVLPSALIETRARLRSVVVVHRCGDVAETATASDVATALDTGQELLASCDVELSYSSLRCLASGRRWFGAARGVTEHHMYPFHDSPKGIRSSGIADPPPWKWPAGRSMNA